MTTQQQPPQTEQPRELGERMSRVEGVLEQVDKRLDGVERSVDRLSERMDALQRELNARIDRLTLAVLGGAVVLAAAIIGGFAAFQG